MTAKIYQCVIRRPNLFLLTCRSHSKEEEDRNQGPLHYLGSAHFELECERGEYEMEGGLVRITLMHFGLLSKTLYGDASMGITGVKVLPIR